MKRREALKTLAAAAALPQAPAKKAPVPGKRAAELIVPRTETLGATDAKVNRYIDQMLYSYPISRREEFLSGVAWLDGHSLNNHAAPFADLKPTEQVEMLRKLSGRFTRAGSRRPFLPDDEGSSFHGLLHVEGGTRRGTRLGQEPGDGAARV